MTNVGVVYYQINNKHLLQLIYYAEGCETDRVCIEYETDMADQKLRVYSTRWRYNGCKRVFAYNFNILNHIFINFISTCSVNCHACVELGHAHFHCIHLFISHYTCKTYFSKLLLGFKLHLHKTLHT